MNPDGLRPKEKGEGVPTPPRPILSGSVAPQQSRIFSLSGDRRNDQKTARGVERFTHAATHAIRPFKTFIPGERGLVEVLLTRPEARGRIVKGSRYFGTISHRGFRHHILSEVIDLRPQGLRVSGELNYTLPKLSRTLNVFPNFLRLAKNSLHGPTKPLPTGWRAKPTPIPCEVALATHNAFPEVESFHLGRGNEKTRYPEITRFPGVPSTLAAITFVMPTSRYDKAM